MNRFEALDQVKGVLLVVVTLGHAFSMSVGVSGKELWYLPNDVSEWAYFFPRFIGHPIAIGFAACMGIGMVLLNAGKRRKGWSERQILLFFMQRGILLVLLQFTLVNLAWELGSGSFDWSELTLLSIFGLLDRHYYFGVLYMLGSCMILSCLLMRVSNLVLVSLSFVILLSPSLYLNMLTSPQQVSFMLAPFGVPGSWDRMWVLYTIIPWLGFVLIGMVLGRMILDHPKRFQTICKGFGLGLIALFVLGVITRAIWFDLNTTIAILHLTRYPPEPLLMIFGLGFLMMLFLVFSNLQGNLISWILGKFGKATLFFYASHLFLYASFASYFDFDATPLQAYGIWITGLIFMLPLCLVYLKFKNTYLIVWRSSQKS